MNLEAIVLAIDAEISRLEKARTLLTGQTAPSKRRLPSTSRKVSEESRARMEAAQTARRKRESGRA